MVRLFDQEKSVKYTKMLTCDVVPLYTCSLCVQDPVFEVSSSLRVKIADLGNACWVVSFFFIQCTAYTIFFTVHNIHDTIIIKLVYL